MRETQLGMLKEKEPKSASPEAFTRPGSSDERFRLLVESICDYAIFLLDTQGYIQSWNLGAQRFKGYTPEEAIGKHFSMFYPADIRDSYPAYELKVATATGRFEEEGWRLRKDGSRFWANVVITRLTDKNGRLVGFAKVTRDLTERKKTEEALRLSEERYRLLVSAVRDYAIFMLDSQGKVTTWNEGAQRLKGYKPEEIIGQHFSKFYPEEDLRTHKPEWELEEATLTGRFEDEGWRLRKDGTRFWANVVITAIRNPQGELLGFSKVTRDITDRRRLEEKLRRGNEDLDRRVQERTAQLEQAIRARDEFLSIVSHELRTPITSLKLQVQTAVRQLNNPDSKIFIDKYGKFVVGANRQLDRLSRLIDDMLDVSRIETNRLRIDFQPTELNALVAEVVERFQEQSRNEGYTLDFQPADPVTVMADPSRLEQVVSNLVVNAMKYGGGKPIHLSVKKDGEFALIVIQDQGIGIAAENLNRIFERFERAVSANSISGMGLGLYISRKIVEAHQGEIIVESSLGKGSTFTVKLSLKK